MVFNILTALITLPEMVLSGITLGENTSRYRWRDQEEVTVSGK